MNHGRREVTENSVRMLDHTLPLTETIMKVKREMGGFRRKSTVKKPRMEKKKITEEHKQNDSFTSKYLIKQNSGRREK